MKSRLFEVVSCCLHQKSLNSDVRKPIYSQNKKVYIYIYIYTRHKGWGIKPAPLFDLSDHSAAKALSPPPSAAKALSPQLLKPSVLSSQIPDPRSQIPVPRSQIPDPRSQIPDPRSPIPDPRSPIPDPRSQIPDPRYRSYICIYWHVSYISAIFVYHCYFSSLYHCYNHSSLL